MRCTRGGGGGGAFPFPSNVVLAFQQSVEDVGERGRRQRRSPPGALVEDALGAAAAASFFRLSFFFFIIHYGDNSHCCNFHVVFDIFNSGGDFFIFDGV